ncbi:T9SS type A sorting domain-containing protein [Hymenobacter monticola]|uniref:T9SS type A sorting domain-containing protein n=1 Tax=Hymenobacter monticola TaxID=1705399 RepID=A0ABY4B9X2_9BACT|nr:T9SS type A sorting domain-containing protein [Hymenobacter monticola]UOE35694.1 T9SS type A sorting domain-containing protein [Hymenobacter monticola]
MSQTFTSASFPYVAIAPKRRGFYLPVLLLLSFLSVSGTSWATSYVVDNPDKKKTFNLENNDDLTISSNVNFEGIINVNGSNVTITVNGDLINGSVIAVNNVVNTGITNFGVFNGTLMVASGAIGTVINNLGSVPSQQVYLNAPTTINNGSASASAGVSWTGYVGGRFAAAPTINNFGSWTAQMQPLPGGTISNKAGATWNAYMTVSAPLSITNEGTWSSQIQPAGSGAPTFTFVNSGTWSGSVTANSVATSVTNSGTWNSQIDYSGALTIVHTAGTWNGLPNGSSGSLRITNGATWTQGFNFPGTGPNSFVNTGTATFNRYLGMGSATTITNSGAMTVSNGMGNISANSSLNNQRGATFRVVGQLVNFGTVSNAGTVAVSGDFRNEGGGVMSGPAAPLRGSITASGYSVNAGAFGTTGRLDFCDAGNSAGFDLQSGTVGSGITFCALRPLPVELAAFTAEAVKDRVLVRWSTATEQNSAVFVVERSADGKSFNAVREVSAQGNSMVVTAYAAADAKPLPGTSYYRLRQVDRDGAVAYSPVAKVSFALGAQPVLAYPNPTTDRLVLDLTAASAEACAVRVLTPAGQVVRTEALTGGSLQEVSLAGLPAGLYLLQVRTATGSSVQRIEKK